jgi:hypothetical protein
MAVFFLFMPFLQINYLYVILLTMKLEVNVPSKLSEIPLHKYQKFLKIVDKNIDDPNADRFVAMKMLEIFCDIPAKYIYDYKIKDITKVTDVLTKMFEERPQLVKTFKIGDTEFGFIPNLEEMTFGEYIDLDTYIGDWDNIQKAMGVLYRPITAKIKDRYQIQKYQGDNYEDAMLNTPMDAVLSSVVFFYDLGIDLRNGIMDYLTEPEKEVYRQYLTSIGSGAGTMPYIYSVTETLQRLNRSLT